MESLSCYSLFSLHLKVRLVYRWFLLVHQVSLMLGLLGYSIILMLFLSLGNNRGWIDTITETGVLFVFYGLYYGLLGRDLAEYCVDNMSSTFKVPSIIIQFYAFQLVDFYMQKLDLRIYRTNNLKFK